MEHLTVNQKTVFNTRLASQWSEFVDCPERIKTLGPFLEKFLMKHKNGLVFDSALGIGCESIFLLKKGFNIISNEIDNTLVQVAIKAAGQEGMDLEIVQQDWKQLDIPYSSQYFDAIFNLGNSLCLLDNLDDIRLVLKNFYNALKRGGTLIVDERNFSYILENKDKILSGNFRYSGNYIYCGKSIKGFPISITNQRVKFGYFKDKNFLGSLTMYPFGKDQLHNLLLETGFQKVNKFSDFKMGNNENADFYTYVAVK